MRLRAPRVVTPLARLVDRPAGEADSLEAWVVDLVRSEGPAQLPVGRRQRLLLSLGRKHVGWVARTFLRPAVIAAFVVGGGAVSSAAITHWPRWVADTCGRLVTPAAPEPLRLIDPRASMIRAHRPPAMKNGPEGEPPAPVGPASEPAPAESRPPVAGHARPSASAGSAEDPLLVVEGMRALRLEGNAHRAQLLLARYLDRHPHGALSDEALALSIQAALDLDDPEAARLSARYLKQHPNGPFRALAERTLAAAHTGIVN